MFSKLSKKGLRIVVFWLVALAVIILDQFSKAAVRASLSLGESRPFLPLLDLHYIQNTGAAFSLGEGAGWFFILIAAVIFVGAFLYTVKEQLPLYVVAPLAAVAGGGVGNMIDRLAEGSVTDFFATTFINFPIFNVADIFVSVGIVVCLLAHLKWDKEQDK